MRIVDACRCGGTFTCRGRKSEQHDVSLEHYLWLNAHKDCRAPKATGGVIQIPGVIPPPAKIDLAKILKALQAPKPEADQ